MARCGSCFCELLSSPDIAVVLVNFVGIQDALQFATSSRKIEGTFRAAALKENQKRYIICILGGVGPPSLATIEGFDLAKESWEALPPMPCRRHGHATVVLDGFLYMLGGSGGLPSQRDVIRFRPATKIWEDLVPMPIPRFDFAAAALSGVLYVAGGAGNSKASGHPLSAVSCFRPPRPGEPSLSGTWEVLPAMFTGREAVAGFGIQGCFYVCGGLRMGGSELRCGERFDVVANRWKSLPAMSTGRAGHAVVGTGGLLVACGGRTHGRPTSLIELLTLGSRCWETLPPMCVRRCRPAAAVFNGKIYVCGGDIGGTNAVASAERYDPIQKKSELLPNLLVARSRATAAIIMI